METSKKATRVAVVVDQKLLTASVQEAEKNGPIKGQKVMLEKVAEIYNNTKAKDAPSITYTVARLRIGEWGIPHQTLPQIKPINRGNRAK